MPRDIKKPDFENIKIGINPFTENLTIAITKKKSEIINKFGYQDIIEKDLEATVYTKVFMVEAAKKQMSSLPIRSKELYLFLIHSIQSGTDYIWIDRAAYMKQMEIKSLNTYKAAVDGLCENVYIQKHNKLKEVYWINPHFFFKGSRILKYKHNLLFKETIK